MTIEGWTLIVFQTTVELLEHCQPIATKDTDQRAAAKVYFVTNYRGITTVNLANHTTSLLSCCP